MDRQINHWCLTCAREGCAQYAATIRRQIVCDRPEWAPVCDTCAQEIDDTAGPGGPAPTTR